MCSFFTIFFFFLLLLLTCVTQILCSKPVLSSGRRILHEPFQPLGSLPPAPPPNPPPPSPPAPPNAKYPFSTTTPNQSPFFPDYLSPPPPSPASFASFPANISSLILPHASKSKSSSGKLLGVAIGAGVCAIVVAGISAFVYCRRRRKRYSADEKTLRSDSSLRLFPPSAESGNGARKVRHTSSTSSEFLYLGTIVNSRGVEDRSGSRANDAGRGGRSGGGGGGSGGGGAAAVDPRKMDSPELRPLPPLARQGSRQQNGVARDDVGSNLADDEEEEFYSPKGSLGGHESSNGTGSGSCRVFAAIASDNFVGRSSESSSSSYSSSTSGSPDRSHSISLSPPASLSPKRSRPKSPESIVVDSSPLLTSSPPLPQPPPPAHPQTEAHSVEGSLRSSSDSSQFSLSPVHNQHVQSSSMSSLSSIPERASGRDGKSPLLSPLSLSPNRAVVKNPDGEARASGVTFENVHSSSSSSPVSSSPERCVEEKSDAPERQDEIFSYSSSGLPNASPDRNAEKISRVSPRLSTTSPERNVEKILSSPQRNSEKISLESPRLSTASCEGGAEAVLCASPRLSNASSGRNVQKISCASPRLSNASNQSEKSLSSSSAFSLPSSPEKVVEHGLDQSPSLSNVSDRYRQSPMPNLLSSPERESYNTSVHSATVERVLDQTRDSPAPPPLQPQRKHWEIPILSSIFGQPERVDKVLDQNAESPAPPAPPQRKHWEIPVFSTPIAQPNVSAPPPPPPPPPPPSPPPLPPHQRTRKQWEIPSPSTPTDQSVSRPPALVPPSKPFVLPNPTTDVSPVQLSPNSQEQNLGINEETPKPKLKPLHWDKVRANSDREMVWDQLRSSSFKLNEEMIETLFVVNTPTPKSKDTTPRSVLPTPKQEDRVLDPKKSQNIAILLRALNVTVEEVCEALLEGSADTLGTELLESLLKMAPSKEEERKLKEHKEDSPTKLGPAEKFLKAVLDVPFAFRRVEAMLYIANFESEVEYLRKSFETLEAACEELRNSRMFLKLLEAVLKTGNRMNVGTNRGDARAFKLDTLLKLVDVKGADGKTTLLHFVVQEIIRTEGSRLLSTSQTPNSSSLSEDAKCRRLGLQVVSSLSSELANVKKAAAMDSEVLNGDVSKLSKGISYITEVVKLNEATKHDESGKKFTESMNKFMRMAEEEILKIQAQESVALSLVKEITEYFHGNLAKEEARPFRIFMVVRDFLSVLDRVCKEVGLINERTMVSSAHRFPVPVNPMLSQPLNPMLPQPLPGLFGKRQYSSSDDDSPSP